MSIVYVTFPTGAILLQRMSMEMYIGLLLSRVTFPLTEHWFAFVHCAGRLDIVAARLSQYLTPTFHRRWREDVYTNVGTLQIAERTAMGTCSETCRSLRKMENFDWLSIVFRV